MTSHTCSRPLFSLFCGCRKWAPFVAALCCLSAVLHISAKNANDAISDYNNQYVLVINSYNENAPWSQAVTRPVNEYILHNDTLFCETVHLNGSYITDSLQYAAVCDRIFKRFEGTHPRGVVMIGSLAFTLRDRVKESWGNVPMLLISRVDRYAPLSYYFSDYHGDEQFQQMPELTSLRKDYNFTVVRIPDLYEQTVELMLEVQPQIEKLVFLADNAWINRTIDHKLSEYINTNHPDLSYQWVHACDSTNLTYQEFMSERNPANGFLMSTWSYPSGSQLQGFPSVVSNNLQLIRSSVNPIFCIRYTYLDIGAVGGVFNKREPFDREIQSMMEKMARGDDFSKIPFYYSESQGIPILNYTKAKEYNLLINKAPRDTEFIDKPISFWERYRTGILWVSLLLACIIIAVVLYIHQQNRQLMMLRKHASFIKHMPWAYSRAKIIYDSNGEIADIEYDLNDMNQAFLHILETNLMPNKKWKIFPFDFISEKATQLVVTGKPVTFTYHFDKTDTYYEFQLCRIDPEPLPPDALPDDLDIFANDITALSKADLKLKRTSRKLDMTLQVSHIVPWQWDLEKHIITCESYRIQHGFNSAGSPLKERSFNITEEDYLKFVYPDDLEQVRRIMIDFHTGAKKEAQAQFRVRLGREGHLRTEWLEINAAVTESTATKRRVVIGSMLVITQRKQQEIALMEAKERASQSDRLKSAFLANMSHEIRTPLNAIIGFSNMLTQTKDDRKQRKYINIIEHNNQLLLHLVNDVLDLAKIESNTLELNLTLTDINAIMEQVQETVRLRVPHGVMFNMVLGSSECMITTDPNRLSQVLINLLTNATKFTTKGSISFGYEEQGDELYFYVTDTGIGISKENQKKLFNRFSKLNNFAQGTGLGLAISKSIINKLGGQIGVKSRGEGKGATFWFTLPYEAVQRPVEQKVEVAVAEKVVANSDVTILVAEDNPSNYILFESILGERYKLIHALDGEEAIAMHAKENPNLILMDIGMPKVDGMQATAAIRKVDTEVPIIAVTAYAFLSDKKKILKSGFNDYVPKPINPHDLLDSIARALNQTYTPNT